MANLEGKVAVVTGASSGIGRSTAVMLAAEGAAVAVLGRNQQALDEVSAEIKAAGGRVLARAVDVRDDKAMAQLMDDAVAEFGRVDIMVNNAGVSHRSTITDGDVEKWREIIDTNLLAMLIGCREAIRVMLPNAAGHIVNMSSGTTRFLRPSGQVYTATKHAMNYITEALREELIETGIRVSVVIPGLTLTNIGRNQPQRMLEDTARSLGVDPAAAGIKAGEYYAQHLERVYDEQPGVYLAPEDVARGVIYAVTQPPHVQVEEVVIRPTLGYSSERTFHDR
ncbi:MAG TPA: SDR family oxidoreductase [Dehalococcoidia bacterium]|nr:SDR family oxidoreductase [Dehalococcoidia bacterium]